MSDTLTTPATLSTDLLDMPAMPVDGLYLKWNAATSSYVCVAMASGGGTPAGSNGCIQFAQAGSFGGDPNFVWDATNHRLGIGTSTPAHAIDIPATNSSNSQVKVGTLEFQPYGLNNAWIGENIYFDGSSFLLRQAGAGGLFYFQGSEGQFRFAPFGAAGTHLFGSGNNTLFKVNADGTVAIGGIFSQVTGLYSGATLVANALGKVGINDASPSAAIHAISPDPLTVTGIDQACPSQSADLRQWRDFTGTPLSGVDIHGYIRSALTSGPPSTTAPVGSMTVDPVANILYIYCSTGWKPFS